MFEHTCCISVADEWNAMAQSELNAALSIKLNTGVAKNVILFIGDGMGVSTVTAARIYKGQMNNQTGEETVLNMETFPHVALSKVVMNVHDLIF